jgi:tRNA isopentenyl-2-thiomethyl-A-37 hydroxylase MiaE
MRHAPPGSPREPWLEPWPLCPALSRLAREELRHFAPVPRLMRRLQELAAVEAELITAPDEVLRFHSGPLAAAALQA